MFQLESISLPHDFSEFSEVIDVRSPSEFAIDHLPGAINLPVLNDDERVTVGTLHKSSPFEARRLGAELIAANAANHLANHLSQKDKSYAPLVYCWRGGMRSNSLTHILRSVGWRARILNGGYKAFRKFSSANLVELFDHPDLKLVVLAGQTGVAKTRLLQSLAEQGAQVLDLEGLANHKGSILGLTPDTHQPSQKQFETQLWHAMSGFDPTQPVFTEAESNRIGCLHCPPALWQKLASSEVVEIILPIDQRAAFLLDDYPYFTADAPHLKALLDRLVKLRGHELVDAWKQQIDSARWTEFVSSILIHHYDLAYRRAGDEKSNYRSPATTTHLSDFSPTSLSDAAAQLIDFYSPQPQDTPQHDPSTPQP